MLLEKKILRSENNIFNQVPQIAFILVANSKNIKFLFYFVKWNFSVYSIWFSPDKLLKTVYKYDGSNWETLQNLQEARRGHTIIVNKNTILIGGGKGTQWVSILI